jgi:hypothetical protein
MEPGDDGLSELLGLLESGAQRRKTFGHAGLQRLATGLRTYRSALTHLRGVPEEEEPGT